jgi:hypothetical protein
MTRAYMHERVNELLCEACRERLAKEVPKPGTHRLRTLLSRGRRNPDLCAVCGEARA